MLSIDKSIDFTSLFFFLRRLALCDMFLVRPYIESPSVTRHPKEPILKIYFEISYLVSILGSKQYR
jgi:hypothetical protein